MNLSICMGYTDRRYQTMAKVAARSFLRHSPEVTIRLTKVEDAGHARNMGTRFAAYVDPSADWVLACDVDVLCFGNVMEIARRAESEGLDFLGRVSGRYRVAPRRFRLAAYARLFREHGLAEMVMHVPNVFLVRGKYAERLAERAAYWTDYIYANNRHVLNQPIWSDQVGFTMALSEMFDPRRMEFFHLSEVADPGRNWRRAAIVHYSTKRWWRLFSSGRLLGMMK